MAKLFLTMLDAVLCKCALCCSAERHMKLSCLYMLASMYRFGSFYFLTANISGFVMAECDGDQELKRSMDTDQQKKDMQIGTPKPKDTIRESELFFSKKLVVHVSVINV